MYTEEQKFQIALAFAKATATSNTSAIEFLAQMESIFEELTPAEPITFPKKLDPKAYRL